MLSSDRAPDECAPPTGVDASVLIPKLEALAVAPAQTGCSMHAKKTTLIAFHVASAAHLDLILAQTETLSVSAAQSHNHVIYAVLGVVDDADAVAAVMQSLPPDRRVLLAGASELKHTSDDNPQWKQYLAEAVLVEFVPDARGSSTGAWILPSSGDACLETVPRGSMSLQEWKTAINRQDRRTLRLDAVGSRLPFAAFDNASGILASTDLYASTMQRTIEWVVSDSRDVFCWPQTSAVWSSVSTSAVMPSWAISTSCMKMIAILTQPEIRLDRQLTISDLQYDVSLTLASMLTQSKGKFDLLKGVLGPIVIAGRNNDEPMRCIEWRDTTDSVEHTLMLLPESYMRTVFPDYDGPEFTTNQWLSGFLCLSNAHILPLKVKGCQAEADEVIDSLGPRLWRMTGDGTDVELLVQALQRSDAVAASMAYRTQQDASKSVDKTGARVRSSTHTIFQTTTSSKDHLSGLRVRWVFAADRSTMPTLDADNRDGGCQLEYETVA